MITEKQWARMDWVERQYERLIHQAMQDGDDAAAYELSVGLSQYRQFYKA